MVKADGQHELQDLPVIAEYEDIFVTFGTVITWHMRNSCDLFGANNTSFTSFIPISTNRDDKAERACWRFIRQGFYQTGYFTVGNIIIVVVKKKGGSFNFVSTAKVWTKWPLKISIASARWWIIGLLQEVYSSWRLTWHQNTIRLLYLKSIYWMWIFVYIMDIMGRSDTIWLDKSIVAFMKIWMTFSWTFG